MATQDQINDITALYVGYFDRAPDPAGLQFWIDQIDGGRPFNTIAADFAASPEAVALYPFLATPDVGSPSSFITAVYANLFNRVPDAAGLEFWTGVLASGDVSVADMIEAIINGAVDDPVANTFDKATLDNKIEVGLDFAVKAGNAPGFVYDDAAAAAAVAVLDGVTNDPATVDAGKLEVDEFLNPTSETLTLTTATDSGAAFIGGEADSVFNAALDLGIDGLVGVQTLQGPDVLDGGAGVNTLNAELNGTGTTQNPTISNIQVYNLTSFAGPLGASELDLSRATGYEQLWNRDSRVDLELFDVGEVAILGMDNVRDGSTYAVNYDNIAVETQVVVVDGSGAAGNSVELDINGVDGVITNLELNVSNDIHLFLDNDAADMANLVIAGSGILDLEANGDFALLETLDTLGYDGDVNLDVSGSNVLTSVLTGAGDDSVLVAGGAVNGGLAVDMGAGANILVLDDVTNETDINGLDFTGGVQNVQTLEFDDAITLTGNAELDLDGFDGQLTTLAFNDFSGGGQDLSVINAPADLLITASEEFEMGGGLFSIDGTVNLTVQTTGLADSDVRLDGGVNSNTLEMLTIEAADDAELFLDGGTDALTTVNVVALGDDADVEIEVPGILGDDAELAALTTVNVTAAVDAELIMTGRAGVAAFAGTQATQSFTINVTAGPQSGFPFFQSSAAGNVFFTSAALAGGFVDTAYSNTLLFTGPGAAAHDSAAADDIANVLDARAELDATNAGNMVNVTWADVGIVDQLVNQPAPQSGATTGTLNSVTAGAFTQGQEAIAMLEGEGFEAVETVTVDALTGEANVNLTDVYGAFTLNVTAANNANVTLTNTTVTSATVAAGMDLGDTATVLIGGDTVGASDLVNLVVSGDQADVTLEDNLESFTTLDVSGVVSDLIADTSGADFVVDPGQFVNYLIGATSDDVDGTVDVDFTGNNVREVYDFVGGDIGEVVITDFTFGADPAAGDRLDLSDFAANAGQLIFADVAGDLVITDLAGGLGDFDGSITIVGAGAAAADVSSFNIIFG